MMTEQQTQAMKKAVMVSTKQHMTSEESQKLAEASKLVRNFTITNDIISFIIADTIGSYNHFNNEKTNGDELADVLDKLTKDNAFLPLKREISKAIEVVAKTIEEIRKKKECK